MSILSTDYHILIKMTTINNVTEKGHVYMYKHKSQLGTNNICGVNIKKYRLKLPQKTSQRRLAEMLQIQGLDIDKNAIQGIEAGNRYVTDIELKAISTILNISLEDLLKE